MPDTHERQIARGRLVEKMEEDRFIFELFDDRHKTRCIGEFRLIEQTGDAERMGLFGLAMRATIVELLFDKKRERIIQHVCPCAQFAQCIAAACALPCFDRRTCIDIIQSGFYRTQALRTQLFIRFDLTLEDRSIFADDNGQKAVRAKLHQRDSCDLNAHEPPRNHHSEAVRETRQGLRGPIEQIVELGSIFTQFVQDIGLRSVGEIVEQLIHERAIPEIGRHATGRGMRRGKISCFFKMRELVAHGSRADVEVVAIDQRARADRERMSDVLIDEHPENVLSSI